VTDAHAEFLSLFLKHEADLRAFIGSIVREKSAREDVLQETALVLWQEFERFDRSRSFGAWARGVAAHKLLKRLDQRRRWPASLPDAAVAAIQAAYDRTQELEGARHDALQHCLDKLPANSRRLLALRYEQGCTLAQLAQRAGSSLEAAHKALSRIRIKLRECVERRLRAMGEA
jgi:RNA polymerase sigma-70 factor (ECF subfamily)